MIGQLTAFHSTPTSTLVLLPALIFPGCLQRNARALYSVVWCALCTYCTDVALCAVERLVNDSRGPYKVASPVMFRMSGNFASSGLIGVTDSGGHNHMIRTGLSSSHP